MPVTATTTLPDTTGLSFDASIEDELTASWTDVTDYGNYRVEFKETNDTDWLAGLSSRTVVTAADATTDWTSGTNATLSTSSNPSEDGTAVRGDTDAAGTTGSRNIGYNPAADFALSGTLQFWYHTDNAGGTHSVKATDGTNSATIDFSSQVTANEGQLIQVDTANFSGVDLSIVNNLDWIFDGPSGQDKFIVVDSIVHGAVVQPQSDANLTIPFLEDGEKYDVRVRSETEHVIGTYQSLADVTNLPAPSGLATANITPSSIDLSWTDNADNEDGQKAEILPEKDNRHDTGYEASWQTDADLAPNTAAHTYSGLKDNWKYKFRVTAYTEHVTATSATIVDTTAIDFQDGFTLVLEDGTGDKLAFKQDELRRVRLPNRHTVINEWEVTLPESPGLESWTYSEAYIWYENARHNVAHQLVYRGEFEVPETTDSRGSTIVRGKDTTRKLKRGGANVTYTGTSYWKAIQDYATTYLPAEWTVTVTEPSTTMLVSDKLQQSASTTAEFDAISTNIASDTPVITGTDQKELDQTAYVSEGENYDSGSDSGSGGLMDRYSDGSTSSVGAATFGDSTGESVTYNFTTTHDIPESAVGVLIRRASEPATSSDLPGVDVKIDGTKVGQQPAGTGTNDIAWVDYNGAVSTSASWSGTLTAGSHTVTLTTTATGSDYFAADVVALVDMRYYDLSTFDNDVGTTGYLDDPGLYPPAGESFRFDIEDVSENIEAARIASTFTDTTGNQKLAVSNDGGKTFPLSAVNTSTLDQTFTDSDVGTLLTGQITLDSYGSRTTATPQKNFKTQAVTDWNLHYDGSDLAVIDDREFTGSHYKIFQTLHRESGMRFVTQPAANALQMDSFKTGDVTKTGSWTTLDHTRTKPDDDYANSFTVYGAVDNTGTRLKATAKDDTAISQDGKEIPAPTEFKPNLDTDADLRSYARTRLSQFLQNDDLTGTIDIVPKNIRPGYSYQVPELDNQTLPLEAVTFEAGGDRGTLDFAGDTDLVSTLTGISTEVSTVKDAF